MFIFHGVNHFIRETTSCILHTCNYVAIRTKNLRFRSALKWHSWHFSICVKIYIEIYCYQSTYAQVYWTYVMLMVLVLTNFAISACFIFQPKAYKQCLPTVFIKNKALKYTSKSKYWDYCFI